MFENILNIENIFNSKMSIRRAFGLLGFWAFGVFVDTPGVVLL
jgi:hypothetical protein